LGPRGGIGERGKRSPKKKTSQYRNVDNEKRSPRKKKKKIERERTSQKKYQSWADVLQQAKKKSFKHPSPPLKEKRGVS